MSERVLEKPEQLIELTDAELDAVSGGSASITGIINEETHESFQALIHENPRG